MRISVEPYPVPAHPTFSAAVAATERHQDRTRAEAAVAALSGATVLSVGCTLERAVIEFDHGHTLEVGLSGSVVAWQLAGPRALSGLPARLPRVYLVWPSGDVTAYAPEILLSTFVGASLGQLQPSEVGLFVTARGHETLLLSPLRCVESGSSILHIGPT
jgi:hypothetical protein